MIWKLKHWLGLLGLAVLFAFAVAEPAVAAHTHSYTAGPHYESTHKSGGHREYYSCYAWDGATRVTGNYSTMSGCSQCYPPAHSCTPSSTWTDSHANNHAKYRFKCSSSSCPKGNNSVGEYMGNASWSWRNVSGLGGHTSSGHAQYRECSYCGYEEVRGYTSDPNCSTCYPPHTHSWVNSGSPSPTHTSSGHAQAQRCSCGSTRTTYVPTLSGCTTCYPHTCTPSSAWTDSSHPHARWYYACTVSSCTKGNYNRKVSAGSNATWSWQINGSISSYHVNGYGHTQPQKCSYSGCTASNSIYVTLSSCTVCYPPAHTCEPTENALLDPGHPHEYYVMVCNDSNCPFGKNNLKHYTEDREPWTWLTYGSTSTTHTANQGHSRDVICSYYNCGEPSTTYAPLAGCPDCEPQRSVSIRVMADDVAIEETGALGAFYKYMLFSVFPFTYTWNIDWDISSEAAPAGLPYNACDPALDDQACDDTCSTDCNLHHKNANNNLEWMDSNNMAGGYDLCYAITGSPPCRLYNNEHTLLYGLAYLNGNYATGWFDNGDECWSMRLIQHELSHPYGCLDPGPDNVPGSYKCTPNQDCIMGRRLNYNDNFTIQDIWCDNCETYFNPDAH